MINGFQQLDQHIVDIDLHVMTYQQFEVFTDQLLAPIGSENF